MICNKGTAHSGYGNLSVHVVHSHLLLEHLCWVEWHALVIDDLHEVLGSHGFTYDMFRVSKHTYGDLYGKPH